MQPKIFIPSFDIPKDTSDYVWERVRLNIDGENIPVSKIDTIVKNNCPYYKVIKNSYCIRRLIDEFGDHVYIFYAVKLPKLQKQKMKKVKSRNKI